MKKKKEVDEKKQEKSQTPYKKVKIKNEKRI